jgi:archaellum component FlaG (FlaF/FlaG flagellin family)
VFKRLVIEVRNTGDVPIYMCDSGYLPQIAVYINGEYAKAALQNFLVLNPGEKGRLTLTTAPVRISQNKTLVR